MKSSAFWFYKSVDNTRMEAILEPDFGSDAALSNTATAILRAAPGASSRIVFSEALPNEPTGRRKGFGP